MNKTTQNTSKTYKFPILSESEIINSLNLIGITGNEYIKDCQPQNIKSLFSNIICYIYNISSAELFSTKLLPSKESFIYPELHEYSIPHFEFINNFKKILEYAGIENFLEYPELIRPTKKRTCYILSGLLNLIKFQESIKRYELKYLKENEKLKKEAHEHRKKYEITIQKYNDANRKMEDQKNKIKINQKIIDDLDQKINNFQNELSNQDKIDNINKKQIEELKINILKIKKKISEKDEDINKIKSQIVQSPEKLQCQIVDQNEEIKSQKKLLEKEKIYNDHLDNHLLTIKKRLKKLEKITKIYNEYFKNVEENKRCKKEYKSLLENIEKEYSEINKYEKDTKEKTKELENLISKRKLNEKIGQEKICKLKKELSEAKIKKDLDSKYELVKEAEIEEHQMKIKTIEDEIDDMKISHDHDMKTADEKLKKFKFRTEQFVKRYENLFEDPVEQEKRWLEEWKEINKDKAKVIEKLLS